MYSAPCTLNSVLRTVYSGGCEVRLRGSVQPGAAGQNCGQTGGGRRQADSGGVLPSPLPSPVPGRDGRGDQAPPGHGQPQARSAEACGPPGRPPGARGHRHLQQAEQQPAEDVGPPWYLQQVPPQGVWQWRPRSCQRKTESRHFPGSGQQVPWPSSQSR